MKKILLTGATDGIGLETAKLLAAQGHHLLIHGRNENKLRETQKILLNSFPNIAVESYCADLSKFEDIRSMMQVMLKTHTSIDVLINNAGVFNIPQPITHNDLDARFVVNTIAPYIITETLLPILTDQGRVINLSSAAQAPISLEAMQGKKIIHEAFQAYAQSKLAITIWSQEVARTLKPEQVMVAVNPGSMLASKMVKEGFGVEGNDLNIGADILLRAALSTEFSNASGAYFDNDSKQFSPPHSDALNSSTCDQVVDTIKAIIHEFYGDMHK